MPRITQYEAPALGLQPTDEGVRAAAAAGGRIARNFDQLASSAATVGGTFAKDMGGAVKDAGTVVLDYFETRERQAGAAAFAQMQDNLTNQWNSIAQKADPNDPTVAARFREDVLEPTLEKYREGFLTEGGQRFAETRIEQARQHLFTKSAADMSSLAAQAVAVNMRQTANSFSNTANSDPSSVPTLLGQVDGLVNDIVGGAPNIKGVDAAKARMAETQRLKESIVKSGAIGAIAKSGNPEATAKEWGERYKDFISGDELKMLASNARQQIRAARIDQSYAEHQAEKQAQRASDQRETQYLQRLYSDDPQQQAQISTRAIVNDPMLSRTAKERMIGVVNRELKPETAAQESNRNAVDLLDRLRKPDGDPDRIADLNPIYQARIDGKINRTDFESLKKEFTELRTPEGQRLGDRKTELLKAVGPMIDKSNPLMGKVDQDGAMNKYRFLMDLDQKIAEYRASNKNPYDLFDPSKPDFFGRPANVSTYQKPLQQSIRDSAGRLRSGSSVNLTGPDTTITGVEVGPAVKVEPRKPGESAADYLKRTGGR